VKSQFGANTNLVCHQEKTYVFGRALTDSFDTCVICLQREANQRGRSL
jgi:hypothetical protein